jgi:hypothetical protein
MSSSEFTDSVYAGPERRCLHHSEHADRLTKLELKDALQDRKLDGISNQINVVLGSIIVLLLGVGANLILLLTKINIASS